MHASRGGLIVATFLAFSSAIFVSSPAAATNSGVRVPAPVTVPVFDAADLPARNARAPRNHVLRTRDPQALASAKATAAERTQAAHAAAGSPIATGARARSKTRTLTASTTVLASQPGMNADLYTPSDSTGAIGPTSYIEAVNTRIRIYSRDLRTVKATKSLDAFIGHSGDAMSDPQIQWDASANRYVFAALDILTNDEWLVFGWSRTSDPANLGTDWCVKVIKTGSVLADYPKLGHFDGGWMIGANEYDDNTNRYIQSSSWVIHKPVGTSCALDPTTAAHKFAKMTTQTGPLASTPVPANMIGSSATGYIVAAADFTAGLSYLTVWSVVWTGTAPVMTRLGDITVPDYFVPAPVPQPGTKKTIDSSDTRLTQAVAGPDMTASGATAIWTQHTIDNGSGDSVVRWYEITPDATTQLVQEGEIAVPGKFAFNGAISPAANGTDAVINYNVGSATQRVQLRAQSRTDATALNAMESEVTLATSPVIYRDSWCLPVCRWGDYAGASPDPVNPDAVWGTTQLAGNFTTSLNWTTQNFALSARAAAPGPVKPDGRIRKGSGAYIGNDIYNADGTNQTKTAATAPGSSVTFSISVQNDAATPDSFTVVPSGAAVTGYAIRYFAGTTDVTAAVVAGTYRTTPVGPGGTSVLKAKVTVKSSAAPGSSVSRLLTITSASDGSTVDAVKLTVSRST